MKYWRMPIEIESPEQMGYDNIECNLAESSLTDVIFGDLNLNLDKLVLGYGDHLGKPELRELLVAGHTGLKRDDVLLTFGASSALFIIATSLLEKGDHVLVMFPNYGTNLETPRQIGAEIELIKTTFEQGWRLDIDEIERMVRPETRYISVTVPHNPTGVMLSEQELYQLVALAEKKNVYLLVDETYREMAYERPLPISTSLSDKVISVSSLSKTYGLPGIRLGWLMTQNKALFETFLAAKEQIFIGGSVLDEEVAYRYLLNQDTHLTQIRAQIQRNLAIVKDWMSEEIFLEWVEPQGGVVSFPRIRADVPINIDQFYQTLNGKYKTLVGAGHWFEHPRHYFRLGFGWASEAELLDGLQRLSSALRESLD